MTFNGKDDSIFRVMGFGGMGNWALGRTVRGIAVIGLKCGGLSQGKVKGKVNRLSARNPRRRHG